MKPRILFLITLLSFLWSALDAQIQRRRPDQFPIDNTPSDYDAFYTQEAVNGVPTARKIRLLDLKSYFQNSINSNDSLYLVSSAASLGTITSPVVGDLVLNTGKDTFWIRQDGVWIDVPVGGGGGGSGNTNTSTYEFNDAEIVTLTGSSSTSDLLDDLLQGNQTSLTQNFSTTNLVNLDSVTHDSRIQVINEGGEYRSNYRSIDQFRDTFFNNGKTYYVDNILGDNANSGTSESEPFLTIDFARSRPDIKVMKIKGGIYEISSFLTGQDTINIVGYGGTPIIGRINDEYTWTTTSYSGVYKAVVPDSNLLVLDRLRKNDVGSFDRMKKYNNLSDLEYNSGAYSFNGRNDTLYVHASDGRLPSMYRNIISVDNTSQAISNSQVTYLENLIWLGGLAHNTSSSNIYAVDCSFSHSINTDLIAFSNSVNSILYKSKFGECATDCIDYSGGAIGAEIDLFGMNAGHDISGSFNQLSTGHTGSQVLTINCEYKGASNQCVFDVNTGTKRLIAGGSFSGEFNKDGTTSIVGVGNNTSDFATMYIEGAKIGGASNNDLLANFGKIYVRNISINNFSKFSITNGGSINYF